MPTDINCIGASGMASGIKGALGGLVSHLTFPHIHPV